MAENWVLVMKGDDYHKDSELVHFARMEECTRVENLCMWFNRYNPEKTYWLKEVTDDEWKVIREKHKNANPDVFKKTEGG